MASSRFATLGGALGGRARHCMVRDALLDLLALLLDALSDGIFFGQGVDRPISNSIRLQINLKCTSTRT